MTDDIEREIRQELLRLRKGWGLQASGLRIRVGPRLTAAGLLQHRDDDKAIRDKLTALVRRYAASSPPDLRLAAIAAFGIDRNAWFPKLRERLGWLADQLSCSERNARRRADEACDWLAQAVRRHLRDDEPPDPERGWQVSRLSALLCLDRPSPELYEERTIVATRDGLAEIQTRASLPVPGDGDQRGPELATSVLFGATLRREELLGDAHYRHTLALPRILGYGEEVSYRIMYLIPRQRMLPHYAFAPFAPCDSFHVRVRFDPAHPPPDVWLLERVAPRLLDAAHPGAPRLIPDAAGDVSIAFADLVQGLGYGVGWQPGGGGE